MQGSKLIGKTPALGGDEQTPLAAIVVAVPLHDEALADELLQHAREALLGDLQDVQEVGDAQARLAVHEMQDAMMGAPEAVFLQRRVGVGGEIAVGEKQELRAGDELLARGIVCAVGCGAVGRLRGAGGARVAATGYAVGRYVSHVDLFGSDCYSWQVIFALAG